MLAAAGSTLAGCAAIDALGGSGGGAATTSGAESATAPAPPPSPAPIDTLDIRALPGYSAPERIGPAQWRRPLVGGEGSITWSLADSQNVPLAVAPKPSPVVDFDPATYTALEGVTTFRGGPRRDRGSWVTRRSPPIS